MNGSNSLTWLADSLDGEDDDEGTSIIDGNGHHINGGSQTARRHRLKRHAAANGHRSANGSVTSRFRSAYATAPSRPPFSAAGLFFSTLTFSFLRSFSLSLSFSLRITSFKYPLIVTSLSTHVMSLCAQ
jgi:hypothetical protein